MPYSVMLSVGTRLTKSRQWYGFPKKNSLIRFSFFCNANKCVHSQNFLNFWRKTKRLNKCSSVHALKVHSSGIYLWRGFMIPKVWYCINTDRTNSHDALFWHTIFSIFLNAGLKFTSYIYATECETCILWKITNVRIIYCNGNEKTKSYLNCVCLCTGLVKNKYIF